MQQVKIQVEFSFDYTADLRCWEEISALFHPEALSEPSGLPEVPVLGGDESLSDSPHCLDRQPGSTRVWVTKLGPINLSFGDANSALCWWRFCSAQPCYQGGTSGTFITPSSPLPLCCSSVLSQLPRGTGTGVLRSVPSCCSRSYSKKLKNKHTQDSGLLAGTFYPPHSLGVIAGERKDGVTAGQCWIIHTQMQLYLPNTQMTPRGTLKCCCWYLQ